MSRAIERMIGILTEQRDCQSELLQLSRRKTGAIADGDIASLQQIIDGELNTLGAISALDTEQSNAIEELSQELAVPSDDVCMSLLIARAQRGQAERLEALRRELTELVAEQSRHNETNIKLLEMNMQYVQFMINSTSQEQSTTTYGAHADTRSAGAATRRLLDREV